MSDRHIRTSKPRRSLGLAPEGQIDTAAARAEAGTVKGMVTRGLAVLALSAVGIAIAGSAVPDVASAGPNTKTSHAAHGHFHAAVVTDETDAFGRSADDTSRSAVRDEVDRTAAEIEAALPAEERQALEDRRAAEERAAEERAAEAARQAEEQRLTEEKRKADEAAAKAAAAAKVATTPMDRASYSLGARWGAVGAWSRYHTGQDLSAAVGTPVYAVAPGVVSSPDAGGWAGIHAIIKHDDGSSLYAHLATTTVSPGQEVSAGELIGYVGMTGRTFGPHLHFEYYPNGAATSDPYSTSDPYTWLQAKGVRL